MNSFSNADNLRTWIENQNHRDYMEIAPGNQYWFKGVMNEFENKDKRYVTHHMKTMIKPDTDPSLNVSKSR